MNGVGFLEHAFPIPLEEEAEDKKEVKYLKIDDLSFNLQWMQHSL